MIVKIVFMIMSLFSFAISAERFQTVDEVNATLIQKGDQKYACPNCGMNLVKFYKTSHTHEDHQYCSLHCLYEATGGKIPENAQVVDVTSLKLIDASKASYVVGSRIKGTMTQISNYAFLSDQDASDFVTKNGGRMATFKEAYAVASEDFPRETSIIPPKQDTKKVTKIVVPKDAKCPVCGMFVAKNPQWAAMIDDNGKSFYFDGVKDMMKYIFAQKKSFDKVFVTDYYKLNKLEAKEAFYVVGSNVNGPMGSELIPFATESEAFTFSRDHNGKAVLNFNDIDTKLVSVL